MKLAFIWDQYFEMKHFWRDGLMGALQKLGEEWEVIYDTGLGEVPEADFYLTWSQFHPILDRIVDRPKGICFPGGQPEQVDLKRFDVIFYESASYEEGLKGHGIPLVRAFGTNTDVFKPLPRKKVFDAIYPATFCGWKELPVAAKIKNILLVGSSSEGDSREAVDRCLGLGAHVIAQRVPGDALAELYNMSRVAVVTANTYGGSQRVVLEAMACGLPVVVYGSEKNAEFVEASGNGYVAKSRDEIQELVDKAKKKKWDTRSYVMENWSHEIYANNLKRGIEEALARRSNN